MKISKLFHYLYATLMFLPIMFFLPSCIYYGFNEHANANITRDTNSNLEQLVENGKPINLDNWTTDDISIYRDAFRFDYPSLMYTDLVYNYSDSCTFYLSFDGVLVDSYLSIYFDNSDQYFLDNIYISDAENDSDTFSHYSYIAQLNVIDSHLVFDNDNETCLIKNIQLFNLTEIFGNGNEPTKEEFESYLTLPYYEYGHNYEITISKGYNISDSINEAWIHVWDLPFFAWTKNSFISQPFTYITGLFGLQANNPLNYLITWFASVSIIWLCFDVVMYLPNLAHRWLDKGAIS